MKTRTATPGSTKTWLKIAIGALALTAMTLYMTKEESNTMRKSDGSNQTAKASKISDAEKVEEGAETPKAVSSDETNRNANEAKTNEIRLAAEPILLEISNLDKEREDLLASYQSGQLSVEAVQEKNRQIAEKRNRLVHELIKKTKTNLK